LKLVILEIIILWNPCTNCDLVVMIRLFDPNTIEQLQAQWKICSDFYLETEISESISKLWKSFRKNIHLKVISTLKNIFCFEKCCEEFETLCELINSILKFLCEKRKKTNYCEGHVKLKSETKFRKILHCAIKMTALKVYLPPLLLYNEWQLLNYFNHDMLCICQNQNNNKNFPYFFC